MAAVATRIDSISSETRDEGQEEYGWFWPGRRSLLLFCASISLFEDKILPIPDSYQNDSSYNLQSSCNKTGIVLNALLLFFYLHSVLMC